MENNYSDTPFHMETEKSNEIIAVYFNVVNLMKFHLREINTMLKVVCWLWKSLNALTWILIGKFVWQIATQLHVLMRVDRKRWTIIERKGVNTFWSCIKYTQNLRWEMRHAKLSLERQKHKKTKLKTKDCFNWVRRQTFSRLINTIWNLDAEHKIHNCLCSNANVLDEDGLVNSFLIWFIIGCIKQTNNDQCNRRERQG